MSFLKSSPGVSLRSTPGYESLNPAGSINQRFPSVSAICSELHSNFHCSPHPCSWDQQLGRDRLPNRRPCRSHMFLIPRLSLRRSKGTGTFLLRRFQCSLFIPIVYSVGRPEHCTRRSVGGAYRECICCRVVHLSLFCCLCEDDRYGQRVFRRPYEGTPRVPGGHADALERRLGYSRTIGASWLAPCGKGRRHLISGSVMDKSLIKDVAWTGED